MPHFVYHGKLEKWQKSVIAPMWAITAHIRFVKVMEGHAQELCHWMIPGPPFTNMV